MKSVSNEMILKRVMRTGDGSYELPADLNNNTDINTEDLMKYLDHEKETNQIWGWDDQDISQEDRAGANIISKKEE